MPLYGGPGSHYAIPRACNWNRLEDRSDSRLPSSALVLGMAWRISRYHGFKKIRKTNNINASLPIYPPQQIHGPVTVVLVNTMTINHVLTVHIQYTWLLFLGYALHTMDWRCRCRNCSFVSWGPCSKVKPDTSISSKCRSCSKFPHQKKNNNYCFSLKQALTDWYWVLSLISQPMWTMYPGW